MIRIGIVGVGFMGMIHYLAARRTAKGRASRPFAAAIRRSWPATGAASRATSARAGEMMDLCRRQEVRPPRRPAGGSGHRPDRRLQSDASASRSDSQRSPASRQARPGREGHRPGAQGRRCHARGGQESGQLLMVAHVLPFFPEFAYRGRSDPRRRVRQAAGRPFQARHLAAGLVGGHRRRRQDRRAGDRSAHSRHALHRPGLRRAGQGVLVGPGGERRRQLPDHAIPLRPRRPGRVLLQRRRRAERPAVRPRLRNLPGDRRRWFTNPGPRRSPC